MTKKIYIKGVRHKSVDDDRLVLAYLILARVLAEQEEQERREDSDEPEAAE